MKAAIIGSRNFSDYAYLEESMSAHLDRITLIVSGGALGADSLAEKFAEAHGIETLVIKPDWKKYGKAAGYIRNTDIISNSDEVFAFWDGASKGTLNSINTTKKQGKPITIFNTNAKL